MATPALRLVEHSTAASIPAQPLQQSTQIQQAKHPPQPCHSLMSFLQLLTHPKHRCHKITRLQPKAKCGHCRSTRNHLYAADLPSHTHLSESTFTWSSLNAPDFVDLITSIHWQRNLLPKKLMVWTWGKIFNTYCTDLHNLCAGLLTKVQQNMCVEPHLQSLSGEQL